ncbi:DUF5329 family protein [Paraburkholderia sp. RL17-337-BIB-A]
MHNKSFTADNEATVVGGRNIADEYFGAGGGLAFADLDVLAVAPAVHEVSKEFDVYWNSASAYPASGFVGPPAPDGAANLEARFAAFRREALRHRAGDELVHAHGSRDAVESSNRMAAVGDIAFRASESVKPVRRLLISLLTCFVAMAVNAAPVSPAAKAEIDGLLVRLEALVCEFNRNGSWYTAAEAVKRLLPRFECRLHSLKYPTFPDDHVLRVIGDSGPARPDRERLLTHFFQCQRILHGRNAGYTLRYFARLADLGRVSDSSSKRHCTTFCDDVDPGSGDPALRECVKHFLAECAIRLSGGFRASPAFWRHTGLSRRRSGFASLRPRIDGYHNDQCATHQPEYPDCFHCTLQLSYGKSHRDRWSAPDKTSNGRSC